MNTYGTHFKITLYGESHQKAIGIVVDGMPPGIRIDERIIQADLRKRKPGKIGTTTRIEDDDFIITSGVFSGHTTGSPVHIMIENKNVRSKDYDNLTAQPRPGHADLTAKVKYGGFHDYRGGGRFSGRLTAALVCAGSLAKHFLPYTIRHELIQVGTLKDMDKLDDYLETISKEGDSVGGIIRLTTDPLPIGLGEPFFEKLDAEVAKMMFSIPAVKGVEIGTGFSGITMKGSDFNDPITDASGKTGSNHSGGVSGGISNGNPLTVKVMIKPTSSIKKAQVTYHEKKDAPSPLKIEGRHDVCIARRAGIVLENALAVVLADAHLANLRYKAFSEQ